MGGQFSLVSFWHGVPLVSQLRLQVYLYEQVAVYLWNLYEQVAVYVWNLCEQFAACLWNLYEHFAVYLWNLYEQFAVYLWNLCEHFAVYPSCPIWVSGRCCVSFAVVL